MATAPFLITIKMDVVVDKLPPVSETVTLNLNAFCPTNIELAKDESLEVPIMPEIEGPPEFLMIRPMLPDPKKIPFVGWIEYSTFDADPESGQRKPLQGTHLFLKGQTEWVADMLGEDGKPGPLKRLFFWNNLMVDPDAPADKKDKVKDEDLKVTIQIFAGYEPNPPKNPAKEKDRAG